MAEYAIVDTDNQASKSGRYFDGFHRAVSIPNIKDAYVNDPDISDADFNAELINLKEDSILSVLDGIFNRPEVIEKVLEFDTCDQQPVLIPNAGRFVGRRIKVAPAAGKAQHINAITLYFNGDVTFNLYLFSSVKKDPLKVMEVSCVANDQVVIAPEDWMISYLDGRKSGVFYIGYFQDDLGEVQAYDEQPSRWNSPKCFATDCIEAARIPGVADFIRFNPAIGSRTYGLNFEISTVVDFTEKISQNPQAFDKAIGFQVAARVIEGLIHNIRSNRTERLSKEQVDRLYNDLNIQMPTQEMPYSYGLKNQLDRELKRLSAQFFPKQQPVSATIVELSCYFPRYLQ